MTVTEILGGGGVFLAIVTLIQISPIQINPWSWIAKQLGRALNGELFDEIKGLRNDVEKLDADMSESRALTARTRILRFNDELLMNQRHSREYFDQILEDVTDYQKYCDTHKDFKNEKAVLAIENIERCYRKCMEDHDFL